MRKVLFILGQLSDEDVEWMISKGEKKSVSRGTILIQEGKPIDSIYIVLEGSLSVFLGAGRKREIAKLGSGEILGEMSFIDAGPPAASVKALENAVVFSIHKTDLAAKLEADKGFAARFYRALATFLSDRLRGTVRHLGYGETADVEEEMDDDELDPNVLDNIHLAGSRFDRMLKRLMAGGYD